MAEFQTPNQSGDPASVIEQYFNEFLSGKLSGRKIFHHADGSIQDTVEGLLLKNRFSLSELCRFREKALDCAVSVEKESGGEGILIFRFDALARAIHSRILELRNITKGEDGLSGDQLLEESFWNERRG
jgi:hypothetical protein